MKLHNLNLLKSFVLMIMTFSLISCVTHGSKNPLSPEKDGGFHKKLAGSWVAVEETTTTTMTFNAHRKHWMNLHIRIDESGQSSKNMFLRGFSTMVDGATFINLQLRSVTDGSMEMEFDTDDQVWFILRYDFSGDTSLNLYRSDVSMLDDVTTDGDLTLIDVANDNNPAQLSPVVGDSSKKLVRIIENLGADNFYSLKLTTLTKE
ncbi:hypothetical protein [Pseudemcibacter aquimaris]|uniref:hypothetical protein n=1 Tax=Pseudemcibacter aquimaris TaxID=2857064 RepID=UPI00201259F6|nr:hypothetical protein [Pseudemcibacter aquimaris]MCC3862652.1 hypothetical protein [Pseudemcibacter aquimaris]WDU57751.1 hypothetical protein KW060_11140 [Pseudemcibacter aquimaris]